MTEKLQKLGHSKCFAPPVFELPPQFLRHCTAPVFKTEKVSQYHFFERSDEGLYLATNDEDSTVSLATDDSENSRWLVQTFENNVIQLKNMATSRFLHQKSGGNEINTFKKGLVILFIVRSSIWGCLL